MKLRNKKTGEIGTLNCVGSAEFILIVDAENYNKNYTYSSLAELNKEWEDVPEFLKLYYVIDLDGDILPCNLNNQTIKKCKSIGNYFETKEEAEKALEKLRAWKRLKGKGIRFTGFKGYASIIHFTFDNYCSGEPSSAYDDLNLLFGGEE